MEKMFVYPENLESVALDVTAVSDSDRVRSKAGIVSYQSKVYRALLDQGVGSMHAGPMFSARNKNAGWGIQKPSHG
jgi:hypothetical protein